MAVTEQDLIELGQALRLEFEGWVNALKEELAVKIIESHNNCAGTILEDVRAEIDAIPEPPVSISLQDVRQAIADAPQVEPGASVEDVESMITTALEGFPAPEPGLTRADVEGLVAEMLPEVPPSVEPGVTREEVEELVRSSKYDDEPIKGDLLRVRAHSNRLAEHIGAPRMKG